jgi:hypothetical protein
MLLEEPALSLPVMDLLGGAMDVSDDSEWFRCPSATRYYVALNETLGEAELTQLVLDWFDYAEAWKVVPDLDLILEEDLPWIFRAWRLVLAGLEDEGMLWIEYVRIECDPVEGFHWIGRDQNESRRYRPGAVTPYNFHGDL